MSLEDILNKIESDGKAEIDKLLLGAKEEAKKILDETESKYMKMKSKSLEKIEEEVTLKKSTEVLSYKNEMKKKILGFKQEIVDRFFESYKKKLLELSKDKYQALITGLTVEHLKTGNEEIIISKKEKKLDAGFLKKLKEISRLKKFNVKFSKERRDFDGGIIIRAEKYEINNTFDILLKDLRERYEIEVMNILFK